MSSRWWKPYSIGGLNQLNGTEHQSDSIPDPADWKPECSIKQLYNLERFLDLSILNYHLFPSWQPPQPTPPPNSLSGLPAELIEHLSHFLTYSSLLAIRRTCKYLYHSTIHPSQTTPLTRARHLSKLPRPSSPGLCASCTRPSPDWPFRTINCKSVPNEQLSISPHIIWDDPDPFSAAYDPNPYETEPPFAAEAANPTLESNSRFVEGTVLCVRCCPTAHRVRHREWHHVQAMREPWRASRRHFFVLCRRCTNGAPGRGLVCDRCGGNVARIQAAAEAADPSLRDTKGEYALRLDAHELSIDDAVMAQDDFELQLSACEMLEVDVKFDMLEGEVRQPPNSPYLRVSWPNVLPTRRIYDSFAKDSRDASSGGSARGERSEAGSGRDVGQALAALLARDRSRSGWRSWFRAEREWLRASRNRVWSRVRTLGPQYRSKKEVEPF